MKEINWPGWGKFISEIITMSDPKDKKEILLFRGQNVDNPLLPKIARKNPLFNSCKLEKDMLNELRLRGKRFIDESISDSDLLVIAQHHGMATRLLDWTTNPLIALWFACQDRNSEGNSHFYIYRTSFDMLIDQQKDKDIFNLAYSKIYRPKYSDSRIIAQQGWFSIHNYQPGPNYINDQKGSFIGLDKDVLHFLWIWHTEIPYEEKSTIVSRLNRLGVNYESIYPDIDGLCSNINFIYEF